MGEQLHYVHGYGFAIGNKALALDDDGPITTDKVLLRDSYNGMIARIAELEAELTDWRDSARKAAGEGCGDEKHCTCVGPLRVHVTNLAAERDELRADLFAAGEATGVAGVDAPMTVAQCVTALREERDGSRAIISDIQKQAGGGWEPEDLPEIFRNTIHDCSVLADREVELMAEVDRLRHAHLCAEADAIDDTLEDEMWNTIHVVCSYAHPRSADAMEDFRIWLDEHGSKWLGPHRAFGRWLAGELEAVAATRLSPVACRLSPGGRSRPERRGARSR